MRKDTYLVWDLETEGLDHNTNDILEIGAIEVVDGVVVAEHNWLLNHGRPVPEVIVNITGITDDLIKEKGVAPDIAIDAFMQVLAKYDCYVTHNGLKFDVPFFLASLKRHFPIFKEDGLAATGGLFEKFTGDVIGRMVDTAVICKANKLAMPQGENETHAQWGNRVMAVRAYGVKYNVGVMCDELGIDKSQFTQHRAMGDVFLTNEIYKKVVA